MASWRSLDGRRRRRRKGGGRAGARVERQRGSAGSDPKLGLRGKARVGPVARQETGCGPRRGGGLRAGRGRSEGKQGRSGRGAGQGQQGRDTARAAGFAPRRWQQGGAARPRRRLFALLGPLLWAALAGLRHVERPARHGPPCKGARARTAALLQQQQRTLRDLASTVMIGPTRAQRCPAAVASLRPRATSPAPPLSVRSPSGRRAPEQRRWAGRASPTTRGRPARARVRRAPLRAATSRLCAQPRWEGLGRAPMREATGQIPPRMMVAAPGLRSLQASRGALQEAPAPEASRRPREVGVWVGPSSWAPVQASSSVRPASALLWATPPRKVLLRMVLVLQQSPSATGCCA